MPAIFVSGNLLEAPELDVIGRSFTAALVCADRSLPEDVAVVIRHGSAIIFVVAGGVGGGARASEFAAARVVAEARDDRDHVVLPGRRAPRSAVRRHRGACDHSPEGIATYRDMLLDAKTECGGDEYIITGGLLALNCVPEWEPPVWQFLSAFGEAPAWGDVGDFSTYGTVVADTLANGVVETCESIDPVG